MRDLENARELLAKAGLAETSHSDEAQAATTVGISAAAEVDAIEQAKRSKSRSGANSDSRGQTGLAKADGEALTATLPVPRMRAANIEPISKPAKDQRRPAMPGSEGHPAGHIDDVRVICAAEMEAAGLADKETMSGEAWAVTAVEGADVGRDQFQPITKPAKEKGGPRRHVKQRGPSQGGA
jgi:hypothetical protein